MNLDTAIDLVLEDQRQSDPYLARDEVVEQVKNSITLPGVRVSGGCELEDHGDDLSEAYKVVLRSE